MKITASKSITENEISSAFQKLQASAYFDNYDLLLREKIAHFKSNVESNIQNISNEFNTLNPFAESLFDIRLNFLPKTVESNSKDLPSSFYTNAKLVSDNRISKPVVFCDMPVDLHVVSVMWLMRFGGIIEKKISKYAHGNRLIIDKNTKEVALGRSLFKPYMRQFQNWWSGAIRKTKDLLQEGEHATIVNFDISSFYHEVKFDFQKLEQTFPKLRTDPVHAVLKRIHQQYATLIKSRIKKVTDDLSPLPIGLLTSHVLANWYLLKLDKDIEKKVRPIYYGRYVDDVLMVVKNTILEPTEVHENLAKEDSAGAAATDKIRNDKLTNYYIEKYLSEILKVDSFSITISAYDNLNINRSKLFIYQFDADYSPNLVEKFVDEQKERASMFRFLSDEEDDLFEDFEKATFESNFENIDANKARFKNLEDNKFKLSSFFSKLIRRRIFKGTGYKEDEVDKIEKYFKSTYLIKHYYFWEKLFTLYLVFDRVDLFSKLVREISQEISLIKSTESPENIFNVTDTDYVNSLHKCLKLSIAMAIGLNPSFLRKNSEVLNSIASLDGSIITSHQQDEIERIEKENRIFRDNGLLRKSFVYYDLLQFVDCTKQSDVNLITEESLSLFKVPNNQLEISQMEYIPIRVKFWQVALWCYYKNILQSKPKGNRYTKYWLTDKYFSGKILDDAYEMFFAINSLSLENKDDIKNKYFAKGYNSSEATHQQIDSAKRKPRKRSQNYYLQEIFVPSGEASTEKIRVCLVNKYVKLSDCERSLDGIPKSHYESQETFDQILDSITKVRGCDLFVMPELSLPHRLLHKYTEESAKKQIAFISGVEHVRIKDIALNFVLTVLPIKIEGERDAVPILRLKNHYAPEEEAWLQGKMIRIPKPNPYRYDLFIWKGFYFAPYYCFELADVFHRSAFFSKLDAIIAPVWNQDVHYYNSIVDSATRDMHNYLILVNTSQYGFSKISRPRDHVNKEKIVAKGGTEDGHPFTLLVGDLRIKDLREFQKLDFSAQKDKNKDKSSFKPTPPDFPVENVLKRTNQQRFYTKYPQKP